MEQVDPPLRVCSYEDRPEAMDSLILMGESLCRADSGISLHVTVPDAPASVRAWAERRPQAVLSTARPQGVTGWDVKPWLLLQQLSEGRPEALWLDDDMIVTGAISALVRQFPRDSLIVTEEWDRGRAVPVSALWGMPAGREIPMINACVIRATRAHRPLLERYLEMACTPRYRAAQALPFESRPLHLLHDGWLLIALLQSREFSHIDLACLSLGRHIAQCAGSSAYRPHHRLLDLFRGLPPLIHGLGRKPWVSPNERRGLERYLMHLADDVSPYCLAARRVAKEMGAGPEWIETRTLPGAALRLLTAYHPAMAGLPLAIPHAIFTRIGKIGTRKP